MSGVVEDCVCGDDFARGVSDVGIAGVQVAVEAGIVATGDFESQAMTCKKYVAGGYQIHCDLVDPSRDHARGLLAGVAIAHAKDSIGDVLRKAVGIKINQLRSEVSVKSG